MLPFDRRTTLIALVVLTVLTLTKNAYMAGLSSYYTFYLIHKFGVAVQDSQLLLFVFLGASAVGVFIGGPLSDRFGVKFVIWFSILGVLPFTLALPYADLTWTVVAHRHHRAHLLVGVLGDRGVCAGADAGPGGDDRGHLLRLCVRGRRHRRGGARRRWPTSTASSTCSGSARSCRLLGLLTVFLPPMPVKHPEPVIEAEAEGLTTP